jgi:hypothetical protein
MTNQHKEAVNDADEVLESARSLVDTVPWFGCLLRIIEARNAQALLDEETR